MNETSQLAPPGSPDPAGVSAPRKRVLLVEGDGFTRLVLLFRLRLAGFQVDFTSNGILALGKLRSRRPDILLLELKLGGLSGLELMKAARAEPWFGARPIYVFTDAERMNRNTRKEVVSLATKLFDKASTSREALVQIFASTFLPQPTTASPSGANSSEQPALGEQLEPGALEEIIAGVREQSLRLADARDPGTRGTACGELVSRVCSLASCAEAARMPSLARHAKALEKFLAQLRRQQKPYTQSVLRMVARAVEVMGVHPADAARGKSSRCTAVVVDEAPRSLKAFEEALRQTGIEPVPFEHPAAARAYLATNPVEIIFPNLLVPEAHGLALANIRQMQLHKTTPVIFGPDPAVPQRPGELPGSVLRLDSDPLLLRELVLRGLNELESGPQPPQAAPASAPPAPAAVPRPPAPPAARVLAAPDDGFELFAAPGAQAGGHVANPSVPKAPRAEPLPYPISWSVKQPTKTQLSVPEPDLNDSMTPMSAAGLTAAPIGQAKPDAPAEAGQTEFVPALATNQIDQIQMDEQPLQMVEQSGLQPESNSEPTPEISGEDQTSATHWAAAAEGDNGAQGQWTAEGVVSDAAEVAPADMVEGTTAGHASQDARNAEALALRLCSAEIELGDARCEIDKRDKTIAALQKDLENFTAARAEQASKQNAQKAAAEPVDDKHVIDLEQQLQQGVAALARVTAELHRERGERQRSDQRAASLNARLQQLHEELSRTLEAQRDQLARIAGLEEQLHEADRALARKADDVEQQQADLRLAEEQLQKAKELNAELSKDRAFFEQAHKASESARLDLQSRLEASLATGHESDSKLQRESAERQRLAEQLATLEREHQSQGPRVETLERELRTAQETLRRNEAELQKETTERRRLQEELNSAQLGLRTQSDSAGLESSKLQSALETEQAERKRQETQLAQMRHATLDAIRSARALRTSLRRQVREPVDNVVHSIRTLLERELGEQEKKLAEAVLQDVLLVQTRLREPEASEADSDTRETPQTNPL
jgi:DNA-binding response OmpR family regulator